LHSTHSPVFFSFLFFYFVVRLPLHLGVSPARPSALLAVAAAVVAGRSSASFLF
jgi:hypothetical protein